MCIALASFATAATLPTTRDATHATTKPAAFFLAGDSTTAAQSGSGGGNFSITLLKEYH